MSDGDRQRAELSHLLRRAGFGGRPTEIAAAVKVGYATTVEALVRPVTTDAGRSATPPPAFAAEPQQPGKKADPGAKAQYRAGRRAQAQALTTWWLQRMVAAEHAHPEKLVLVWHGHWATSIRKVKSARLMLAQNETLRRLGAGNFTTLARAMVRDPALLVWLDAPKNRKTRPNENLSREFVELFTLGIGHYSEDDVREAARALTGWRVDKSTGSARLRTAQHDERPKTVLGTTANLDDQSLVDLILRQPASAPFVITSLWQRFASPDPPPADAMTRLLAAYGPRRDIRALIRAMLLDPVFRSAGVRNSLVKQPVEYVVGTLRALHVAPTPAVAGMLAKLGQVPFAPPTVGGWPAGAAWLTTSAAQERLTFAEWAAGRADLSGVQRQPPAARLDAVARLLSVDAWTPRTRAALAAASGDPARLVTLALISPEYVVS